MSLLICEGCRKSGKTYLIEQLLFPSDLPIFKFNFQGIHSELKLQNNSYTHGIGLGKEVMLHQLHVEGLLPRDLIVDRGIITNSVWGIMESRVSFEQVIKELRYMIAAGYFKSTKIIYIEGESMEVRTKDQWDYLDSSRERESILFKSILDFCSSNGVEVNYFKNNIDQQSVTNFKQLIGSLCAEY